MQNQYPADLTTYVFYTRNTLLEGSHPDIEALAAVLRQFDPELTLNPQTVVVRLSQRDLQRAELYLLVAELECSRLTLN